MLALISQWPTSRYRVSCFVRMPRRSLKNRASSAGESFAFSAASTMDRFVGLIP
ncbi:Uncharacterised protein [Mycobacteroides abscessus subsp. abscessus]|nr:Uncharacterised protein [Mycobacteroides abscessus subsp. abscessus]